jgi:penicillin-binding protein 2
LPEPLALKDHSGESQIYYERVAIAFGVVVVLTLLLMLRMVYLQVVQHDLYATLSDKNRIEVRSVPPIRGLIYDRNGDLIADNVPSKNLNLVIERVRDLEATLAALDQIIDLDDDEVDAFRKRLTRSRRPFESVPLRFGLTEEENAVSR